MPLVAYPKIFLSSRSGVYAFRLLKSSQLMFLQGVRRVRPEIHCISFYGRKTDMYWGRLSCFIYICCRFSDPRHLLFCFSDKHHQTLDSGTFEEQDSRIFLVPIYQPHSPVSQADPG